MNKFKKILLGVASVLTLGALFVVSAVKINAIEYSETHDYAWEASDFYSTAATGIKGGSFDACEYGIISFGDSGYNIGTYSGVTNNTDETLGTFALIPSGGDRTMTFVVPSGQTKVSITMFVANINKTASNGSYPAATSNNRAISFSGSYSNLKYDGTTATSISLAYDAKVHVITFDYTGSTTIKSAQNAAFLGAYGDNVATVGYNVTYVSEHGTAPTQLTEQTTLPATLPSISATGYIFGGWYTDSNCTEGNEAVAGAVLSGSVTLYAKWTVNASEWCTINFDANGGTCSKTTDSAVFGSSYSLPNATKSGYYLTGWSDGSNTYAGTYTVPSTSTKELTAQWAECIVFDESCYFSKANNDNVAAASNSMFTVSGNVNTNADALVTYNGQTYNTPLKMESSTSLSFTLSKPATVYIAFASETGNCKIQGGSYSSATKKTATNGVLVLELTADTYTITKVDTNNIGFIGVIYDKLSDGTTASVFAEKNTAGDTLRFVGTLTGIKDLDNIQSVELVLKKGGVASKKQIFLTTCYTSVTGTSQTCAQADNTYYVIYRLNGIKDVTGDFTKQLVITFTDNSTTSSEITNFSL